MDHPTAEPAAAPRPIRAPSPLRTEAVGPEPASAATRWDSTLRLQRAVGNAAVAGMVQAHPGALPATTGPGTQLVRPDLGGIPVRATGPIRIQPMLAVGAVNDSQEQEADRVSERVMRMPDAGFRLTHARGGDGPPDHQMGKPDHGDELLQMQSAAPSAAGSVEAPPIVHEVLSSPGQPLEPAARAFMESRFGRDFSRVRVHTDQVAVRSAEAVAAHAYTVGSDVVFGLGRYAPSSRDGRRLLAHELAHVVQQDAARPVLRRFPDCRRLLSTRETGPFVAESSVQDFLAAELEMAGDVEREFPVSGASAAPWRTEGRPGTSDTVIDPQLLHEWITGRVDIALWPGEPALDFLEVKRASWTGIEFAEQQLANYVAKGNEDIYDVQRRWRSRTRNSGAIITSVRGMPTSRYAPPNGPVTIDNQQVLLAWCGPGVMLFKALDVNNEELLYCGISDEGRTDAFIGRVLGRAEEMVAQAIRRRLRELFPSDPVNIRLLLNRVRERLQRTIRWLLSEAIKQVCAMAVEVTLAAVLDRLRRMLWNQELLDGLLIKLTPQGEGVELHLGESAAKAATVITVGTILYELLSLAPAFI